MTAQPVLYGRSKDRDFIMVVQASGTITTLRLRDIKRIEGGDTRCRVWYHQNTGMVQINLLEGADPFRVRCEGLQEAIELQDCVLIDQYFAPRKKPI